MTYTPYVERVVFQCASLKHQILIHHNEIILLTSPKLIPWFVSDVTPPDFKQSISSLLSGEFFVSSTASDDTKQDEYLHQMVSRWRSYLESGVFALSVPGDTALGQPHHKVNFMRLHA